MKETARESLHVGNPAKSFSAAESAEPERRGWDEEMYNRKKKDTNNHYDFSRKDLNFEINSKGEIVPLGSNPPPRPSENGTLRHITVGRAAIATPPEPI